MPKMQEAAPDWRTLENVTVQTAAALLTCSRPHIYALAKDGRVEMVKTASGRTAVTVASVKALLARSARYVPTGQDARGRARARQQADSLT